MANPTSGRGADSPVVRPIDVLLVDDNLFVLELLSRALREMGFAPTCAHDGQDALHRLAARPFPIVITDLEMPIRDGVAVITALRESQPSACCLALAGPGTDAGLVHAARSAGACCVLTKPFSLAQFQQALLQAQSEHLAT